MRFEGKKPLEETAVMKLICVFQQILLFYSAPPGLSFGAGLTSTAQSSAPSFGGFSTNLSTSLTGNKTTLDGGFGLTATTTTATLSHR